MSLFSNLFGPPKKPPVTYKKLTKLQKAHEEQKVRMLTQEAEKLRLENELNQSILSSTRAYLVQHPEETIELGRARLGLGKAGERKGDLDYFLDVKKKMREAGLDDAGGDNGSMSAVRDILDTEFGKGLGQTAGAVLSNLLPGARQQQGQPTIEQPRQLPPASQPRDEGDAPLDIRVAMFLKHIETMTPETAAVTMAQMAQKDQQVRQIVAEVIDVPPNELMNWVNKMAQDHPEEAAQYGPWIRSRYPWFTQVVAELRTIYQRGAAAIAAEDDGEFANLGKTGL